MRSRIQCVAASTTFVIATAVMSADARADESIIKNVGDHPDYRFEAEPHGLVGFGGPFKGGKGEVGVGFRGTVIFLNNGFIPKLNNSAGITFGADVFFGNGTVFIPVALQWNFWLSTHWSVFAEPGAGFAVNREKSRALLHPVVGVGGRYHFNERIALTFRLGYPAFSVGASFLF